MKQNEMFKNGIKHHKVERKKCEIEWNIGTDWIMKLKGNCGATERSIVKFEKTLFNWTKHCEIRENIVQLSETLWKLMKY